MSKHIPVLANEVVQFSSFLTGSTKLGLDVTFGLGGHSRLLLDNYPDFKLIVIDKDDSTRLEAAKSFDGFKDRFQSYHSCFSEIESLKHVVDREYLDQVGELRFDLILADLGISSVQLDNPERGLSFKSDSSLDMRMNQNQDLTAEIVLNTYSERDLFLVFAKGGVGARSKALARAVVSDRPFNTTSEFRELCNSVLRSKSGRNSNRGSDLATVPFQAVRIEVNNEFENLKMFLVSAIKLMNPGSRLLVISFHSLEDKIVAGVMRWWGAVRDRGLHPEDAPLGKILTRKPIKPSEEELQNNSRSRSAMLRVFERNDVPLWVEREFLTDKI